MSIQLTSAAASRVRQFLGEREGAAGLRFGVRKTGCSGWAYTVDIAPTIGPADEVFEQDGLKIIVDREALAVVDGTEIDFVRQGLNRVFVFRNPRVTAECGCGESFSVERSAEV